MGTNIGARSQTQQQSIRLLGSFALLLSTVGAGVLLILPLGWREQAILGTAFIIGAIGLNRASSSPTVTLALMVLSLFCTLRYGYFRVTQTYDGITSAGHLYQWDTVLVLVLLAAELYAFVTLVLGYFQTLRPLRRPPVPLTGAAEHWPTVDVFIPTYNEPLTVVRATVLGALAMEYPAGKMRVFVLDDGKREEFRKSALELGAEYVTRDTNQHAKAGNINHALEATGGELVAIFDCDHIPTRSFLQVTVGWFQRDAHLGLVQTPHHFYSPDPFERNLGSFRRVPNEGELFHRLIQDGNDLWNATFFCGSCAVIRRSALLEIGGIAVETVTEDAHTALRMQRRGWSTAYINIPQAAGLATESLAAHIGQRIRWARGMIQILRLENPLFGRGLTLAQRLCYLNASTHFLFAVPRLIFLTMPLSYLLFGMVNIYGYSLAVFAYALPHIAVSNLTNSRVQGHHRFSFWNEVYEAVLAPYILMPTLMALINPRLGKFNVTSKGGVIRRSYFDARIALPFVVLLALNVAGLVMAGWRLVIDSAHHDTVIMNGVWTLYNTVILSVAASVAWERRQRRSEPRVGVRVPLTLVTDNGYPLSGVTADLSCHGVAGYLDAPVNLPSGTPVTVVLNADGRRCDIPARVAQSAGQEQHLRFSRLDLRQERYVLSVSCWRPDAWLGWSETRRNDRPIRSLSGILWLAARGAVIVPFGLLTLPRRLFSSSGPPVEEAAPTRKRHRAPVTAASVLFLTVLPSATAGQGTDTRVPVSQPPSFQEAYDLRAMGAAGPIVLEHPEASQNLFFGVPVTKIISEAVLQLSYAAPLVSRGESRLALWLNGTRIESIPLVTGTALRTDVVLPADLLTSDNRLVLQLEGTCAACTPRRTPWITISPRSALAIRGSRLPVPDELSLLPVPFFDWSGQRAWSLPVVFARHPEPAGLEAASLVTSWFGVLSDVRGVRFPVSIGDLPEGNAVVFALRGTELANRLSIPQQQGPAIAVHENPRDPYGKLLILAGDRDQDLKAAARALVIRRNLPAQREVVGVQDVEAPERREYDAPRWLRSDRPASVGAYTTADRLTVRGSGSLNIYFRLPPDLFLPARQSVPLNLMFEYAGVVDGSPAAMHLRLNGQDIDTVRLPSTRGGLRRSEVIRLPTGAFRTYTNTLTVDVDFGRRTVPDDAEQYLAIARDSTVDLQALPHSVVLPRLELFADAGYPFTQWPDLRRTAVVLPNAPTPVDYETVLDMAGFFGAQTGSPATAITVTDPRHFDDVRDKDFVIVGSAPAQPLLTMWADRMALQPGAKGFRFNPVTEPSRLLHQQLPFRRKDRSRLAAELARGAPIDLVVQHFVSPFRGDRSVIAIMPLGSGAKDAVAALFMPAVREGPVYGGVTIAQRGRFQSFLTGIEAYHSGDRGIYPQATVFLFEYYWLIPLVVVLVAFLFSARIRHVTESVATRRLVPGESQ